MRPNLLIAACAFALVFALSACASAQTVTYSDEEFTRIESGMNAMLDALEEQPDFAPGYMVVVATADGRTWARTGGTLRAGEDIPAQATSEFYIASMTKAYMGLLAAQLDLEGILSLDSTLADHWPDLHMPGDVPASEITLRDLITHQIPIEVGQITGIEANFRDIPAAEYPYYIETYGVPRDPGFQYDNLGYNIYGAILEVETGKNWRDWLNDVIFEPNGMTGTSGRVSDFDPDTIAWGHQLDTGIAPVWPSADGWYLIHPKTDGMMQSAGGLMTNAPDFATWIRMNLTHEAEGISPAAFEEAQTQRVEVEGDGHGFSDEGYAYGWNNAILIYSRNDESIDIPEPEQLLQHGGGYTGYTSLITFAPDLGIGIAVAFNTDGAINFAALEISKQLFELAVNLPGTAEAGMARADFYGQVSNQFRDMRVNRMATALEDERWGAGDWTPDTAVLDSFTGRYDSDGWIPYVEITRDGDFLRAQSFDAYRYVVPMSEDIFGGYSDGANPPEYLHFLRNESGAVTGLQWDDDTFVRVSDR